MKWLVKGNELPTDVVGSLKVRDVLYEMDEPLIYTAGFGATNDDVLVYTCDRDAAASRLLVVPSNPRLVERLTTGQISVREALSQAWAWVVERRHSGEVAHVWRVDIADVPSSSLPSPRVMLWPQLSPILSVRFVGEGLGPGTVPASVVTRAVQGASKALRWLVAYVLDRAPDGRPHDSLRKFYDLPTQAFAFSSFEVAFRPPQDVQADLFPNSHQVLADAGQLLADGLRWAASGADGPLSQDEELELVVLRALQELAPPAYGLIQVTEVGGRLVGTLGAPQRRMDRESSRRIRERRKAAGRRDVGEVLIGGVVRELDKDKLSFTLRETWDGKPRRCVFSPEFLDGVEDAFVSADPVIVFGTDDDPVEVVSFSAVPEPPDQDGEAH